MYAILGQLEFDVLAYFDGMGARFGADYAEHGLIGRKPRLQHVGDKLDEISIDLAFHVNYCDPEAELVRLRNALANHAGLSLVLGNGDYKGRFVITDLDATSRHTDKVGTLLSVEASIKLREVTGDPARPSAPAVRAVGSATLLPAKSGLVKALPASATSPTSALADAVTAAKGALATAGRAMSAYRAVQSLATGNPLTALARLPGVANSLRAAIPGLDDAADQVGRLTGLSSVVADAASMVQAITGARADLGSLAGQLAGATPANLGPVLASASSAAGRIEANARAAVLPMARMTARAATRTV